jgi:NADH pyrophosphatase NudC (nudix superfamily)
MTLGSLLIGIAVTLVVVAYLARPFRAERRSVDAQIEAWVAEARRASTASPPASSSEASSSEAASALPAAASDDEINFCPQCGRKVAPDHRFCPGCGYQLR